MPNVLAINALEPEIQKLTDAELRAKTGEFRQRIQERLSRFRGGNTDRADSGVASEQEDDLDRTKRLEKQEYDALQEALDEILVEAFAVVREAGAVSEHAALRRAVDRRHRSARRHDRRDEDR